MACAIAVATIVGCGLSLSIALLAVRLDRSGFSARAVGFNTAAGGLATFACAPFIPFMARFGGVARLLMAALVLGGLMLVGFTLTDDYLVWLALRFGIGAAVTVMFVLSEFWITSAAPARRRGLAIGCYVTSLAIGFAVGPLILTFVGTVGNLPFYIGGALFVGAALPLMLNAREAPSLESNSREPLIAFVGESPAAALAALLHGAIEVAGLSLLPVYALRSGLTIGDGALFSSLFILGNSLFQIQIGFLSDHLDARRLFPVLGIAGLIGACFLALLGTSHIILFDVGLLVWGGIVGAFYPVGLAQLGASYKGAELAEANSAYVMTYALGMLAGPPLVGLGLDLVSPSGFFWAAGFLVLVYLLLIGARTIGRSMRRARFS